jgi:protein-tyrosine phosphatase
VPGDRLHGAIEFPDGAAVRGRGLRRPLPGGPRPEFGLYLGGRRLRAATAPPPWPHAWLQWPDFWLPTDREAAQRAIVDLHARSLRGERVEVACGGGIGRTGTVLACVAILAGVPSADAVAWVRERHDRHAVETPWQRRWVRAFGVAALEPPG